MAGASVFLSFLIKDPAFLPKTRFVIIFYEKPCRAAGQVNLVCI